MKDDLPHSQAAGVVELTLERTREETREMGTRDNKAELFLLH